MKKTFTVVYGHSKNNWGAYSPDVDGCIATGKTRADVEAQIQSALRFHFEGMLLDGEPIPEPEMEVGTVDIEIPTLAEAQAAFERDRVRQSRRRTKRCEPTPA